MIVVKYSNIVFIICKNAYIVCKPEFRAVP